MLQNEPNEHEVVTRRRMCIRREVSLVHNKKALIKEKTHICEPFLRFVIKFIDWQIC